MGLAQQSFGAGWEHGPAALFDLWLPASQLGKEIIHFLLHCGLGAQAQVGGHLLAHPVPDRLIRIEVWAVARQVHQTQAQSRSRQVGPQDIAAMRRGIIPNHRQRSPDLLILDDLGLHGLTAQQSADLYELILNRHRASSFIITSNRAVDEWLGLFDDPILGNSALDRLANASYQIVIEGASYRERLSPHRALLAAKGVIDPQTTT